MELIPGPIPAPQVAERRKGALLTSAIPGPDIRHWRQGVVTWPESAPSYRIAQACTDDLADYGEAEEFGPVAARAFTIQGVTHCPRTSVEVMAERARQHVKAITSQAMAYELWTGDATSLDPWTLPDNHIYGGLANQRPASSGTADEGPYLNPYLADAGTTMLSGTYTDPTAALGAVEAAVAERMAGGPIYLHVPVDFVAGMGADLREEGDFLRTPLGSIVIADAGYPGPGATGTDLVIYGTGPLLYWLSEPVALDKDSWVVDFRTNRVAAWAERDALMWFDPQTLVGCTVSTA